MTSQPKPPLTPPAPTDSWRRLLLENALDAVVGFDEEGTILDWNRQAEVTFGWTKDQALGKSLRELILGEHESPTLRDWLQLNPGRLERELVHRNGASFPVETNVIPVRAEGQLLLYAFIRDISDRRALEKERQRLLESERVQRLKAEEREDQLRLLLDESPAFIAFVDSEKKYRFANKMYERFFGQSVGDVTGKHLREVLGEENYARSEKHIEGVLSGNSVRFQTTLARTGQAPRHLDVQYVPHGRRHDKEARGFIVIAHDVTERQNREEDQALLSELHKQLTLQHDVTGVVATATALLAKALHCSRCWFSEIDDKTGMATVHQDFARALPSLKGRYALQTFGPEMVASWRKGPVVILEDVTVDPRTEAHAQQHLSLGIRAFITAPLIRQGQLLGALNISTEEPRVWAEREGLLVKSFAETLWPILENTRLMSEVTLQRSRLMAMLEQMPAGVILAAPSGELLLRNRQMDALLGGFHKAADIRGYDQYVGFRSDGTRYKPEEWPLSRSLLHGEVVRDEEINLLRLDGRPGTLAISSAPVHDDEGRVVGAVVVHQDVTARKDTEERLKDAVRARDEFLSIASHELRTPLTSIKLQFDAAQKRIESKDPSVFAPDVVRRRVALTLKQLGRMARLIEDMLDVSRISSGHLKLKAERLDLSALSTEVVDRLTPDFEARQMTLTLKVPGPVFVMGDPQRLDQVLENLLTNALKYGGRGEVTVSVESSGGLVRLRVRDQGMGIAPENLDRVFDRFERAVSPNDISGLGLGLFISRRISEAHPGGRLWAESPDRAGAIFTLELPRLP